MATGKKLADKAARLDFSNLPKLSPETPDGLEPMDNKVSEGYKAKTAPGAMMAYAADARSELIRENEELKLIAEEALSLRSKVAEMASDLSQWDGARATRLLDPKRIHRSRWANRHERNFQDPEFLALKDELLNAGGNVQPIKVRQIGRDEDGDVYEIVFGHRRHQGCLDLGLPVLAVIENVSDQGLFVEMDRENRARKNLSPWEQGMMYLRALEEGLFPSQRKLAEAVGSDLSALGKALNLARLPVEVVNAFPSPLDIQFRWAKPLTDALSQDGNGVLERAAVLASSKSKPSARSVFEHLINAGSLGGGTVPPPPETTLLKSQGKQVGVLNRLPDGAISVQLRAGVLDADQVSGLAKVVTEFLKGIGAS